MAVMQYSCLCYNYTKEDEKKQQRHYEKLLEYTQKLEEYVEKIQICGENRNSYSKSDLSATFMRIKTDYINESSEEALNLFDWKCFWFLSVKISINSTIKRKEQ